MFAESSRTLGIFGFGDFLVDPLRSILFNMFATDPPENINISEIMITCPYEVPVVLTCTASGYPVPTYKWFDLTNVGDPYEGSTVKIDCRGTYQSVASNTIRDVIYSESVYVNVSDCCKDSYPTTAQSPIFPFYQNSLNELSFLG